MVPKKNVVFFQLSELGSDLAYSFCAAAKPVLNVCGIQLETLLELMLCRHRSDGRQIIKGIDLLCHAGGDEAHHKCPDIAAILSLKRQRIFVMSFGKFGAKFCIRCG